MRHRRETVRRGDRLRRLRCYSEFEGVSRNLSCRQSEASPHSAAGGSELAVSGMMAERDHEPGSLSPTKSR